MDCYFINSENKLFLLILSVTIFDCLDLRLEIYPPHSVRYLMMPLKLFLLARKT